MKRILLKLALAGALLMAPFGPQFFTCFAQGSLTPPGPPAPTMKSLDQIEPRTIVNAVNTPGDATDMFIISKPGSYYLTTNIVATNGMNGITIMANNITLDLGGFSVMGTGSGSYSGICLNRPQTNITVRNGSLSGWGNAGILSDGNNAEDGLNYLFERLNVSASGDGFYVDGAAIIRDCTAAGNSGQGIVCGATGQLPGGFSGGLIVDCTAIGNQYGGIAMINGNVSGCYASVNSTSAGGNGGFAVVSGAVSACTAYANGGDGFYVLGGKVSGCMASANGVGIYLDYGELSECEADGNQGDGFSIYQASMRGCAAIGNYSYGMEAYIATISASQAEGNTDSGIFAEESVISGCNSSQNQNNGVESHLYVTATGCMVYENYNNGIFIDGTGSVISDNNCVRNNTSANSGCAGICSYKSGANNRIENNQVTGTSYAGITVSGTNNIVIKNSVAGNGANNFIISGNQITGPMITGAGAITSSSPWANFSY